MAKPKNRKPTGKGAANGAQSGADPDADLKRKFRKSAAERPRPLPPEAADPFDAPRPGTEHRPGRRVISRLDATRRALTIRQLLVSDTPLRRILEHCREQYHLRGAAARALVKTVTEEIVADHTPKDLDVFRAKQLARLADERRTMLSPTKRNEQGQIVPDPEKIPWGSVIAAERLAAAIAGTTRPIEVNITGQIQHAVMAVVTSMTTEELDAGVAEQLEVADKARRFDEMQHQKPVLTIVQSQAEER